MTYRVQITQAFNDTVGEAIIDEQRNVTVNIARRCKNGTSYTNISHMLASNNV
jgi:hypothetical protein